MSKPLLKRFLVQAVKVLIVFSVCFCLTTFVSQYREAGTTILFSWETAIPFCPVWYVAYISALFMPIFVPLYANSEETIDNWAVDMCIAIIMASIIFLIYPTKQLPLEPASQNRYVLLLNSITGEYNLFPSLHSSLAAITFFVYLAPVQNWAGRLLFFGWFCIILVSTLFTHKHHVADLVGGFIIALIAPSIRMAIKRHWQRRGGPTQGFG